MVCDAERQRYHQATLVQIDFAIFVGVIALKQDHGAESFGRELRTFWWSNWRSPLRVFYELVSLGWLSKLTIGLVAGGGSGRNDRGAPACRDAFTVVIWFGAPAIIVVYWPRGLC